MKYSIAEPLLCSEKGKSVIYLLSHLIFLTFILLFFNSCSTTCKICRNYPQRHWPKYAQHDRVPTSQLTPHDLKVVSFNLYHCRNIEEAIDLFKDTPELKDADFILLQEKDFNGIKLFADALQYNYVYYPSAVHQKFRKDFGNAVLSKWPIVDNEKIILTGNYEEHLQRIAVGITALVGEKKLKVYSIHQGVLIESDERSIQLEKVLQNLDPSIEKIIIGGDFNTITKRNLKVVSETFKKHQFNYATKEIGWTYQIKLLLYKKFILDHIYTRGIEVMESGRIVNFVASDHIPIWVKFKL